MTHLLGQSLSADRPMIDDGRTAPTGRQLTRNRRRRLLAELEPTGELAALRALARGPFACTEEWQVLDLPLYLAFR